MMKQEDLLKRLKEHQPIIINYGKGYFTNSDIKEYATWNEKINAYMDSTGIWDTRLLIEIAKNNVESTRIEIGG